MAGLFGLCFGVRSSQIMVVDIIPESLSGETVNDSEPNLAVNPANPLEIAASAYTEEPLNGNIAPIFTSTNGGQTWSCRSIIPSPQEVFDITLRFSGAANQLYVSTLLNTPRPFPLLIGRTDDFARSRSLDHVADRGGNGVDQPYIEATTSEKRDRVFVGEKDYNSPNGETATIDRSLDGAPGSFAQIAIEKRLPGIDNCEIRPAISADGKTVYAVFNHVITDNGDVRTADVVLVRDDEDGNSTAPFTALSDPEDHAPGLRVVKNRTFNWNHPMLGKDRLGGDLAVAVDPRDARKIYLVWIEQVGNVHPTLHLRYSKDAGVTWSTDVRTITDAKNPGLAVNEKGTVGFLYQQVIKSAGGKDTWTTNLERSNDDFATDPNVLTLATFPVDEFEPGERGQPFLGDYLSLMAVGNGFYGIFSSSNVPEDSRFPCKVIFQRRVDRAAKKLLGPDGKTKVDASIDPFFFKVTE